MLENRLEQCKSKRFFGNIRAERYCYSKKARYNVHMAIGTVWNESKSHEEIEEVIRHR